MRKIPRFFLPCGLALCTLCAGLRVGAETGLRKWTDALGRTVEAEFAGMDGGSVLLKMSNGQMVPYPLDKLSTEDQAFVTARKDAPAAPAVATAASGAGEARTALEKRQWPGNVAVSTRAIEIKVIEEKPAERRYVYQSEAFEFTSQAKLAGSVMTEVARTFEATRAVINALPWGVVCQPPDGMPRFLAALYETRQDYINAGGPELSGGVYQTAEKTFRIPFQSLGLEKRGQTYFKNDFSNDTLVHEITHQMMHDYLGFLPTWLIEGMAEYVELLPYRAGIFRADSHKTAMKSTVDEWVKRGHAPMIPSVQAHMNMNREGWGAETYEAEKMREMYRRSILLVYFFSHLDGDKKGTRFLQFLEAVYGEVEAMRAFFSDPRVKRMEGGRFTYPSALKPPAMYKDEAIFKHLGILVAERPYEKIAADIVEGYKTIGLKVDARP